MNLLSRLFGKKQTTQTGQIAFIKGPGTFDVDVVGESRYQDNLGKICGKRSKDGEEKLVTAALILEDNNPTDNQAIRIDIDGLTVGYFSSYGAKEFRKALQKTPIRNNPIQCQAMIVGGWQRGKDIGHYGVKLDLPHD